MKIITAAIIALLVGMFNVSIGQTINANESYVSFDISNKGDTVNGKFTGMKGDVKFDENDLANSSFDVCIDPKTVNTESKMRDGHLQKKAFFGVELFPTICFKSTSIEKSGNGYVATGELNLHGITKTIKINFTKEGKTLQGSFNLNRLDYKIGEKFKEKMIGFDVAVNITCVLN